jgi:hypothetical protein
VGVTNAFSKKLSTLKAARSLIAHAAAEKSMPPPKRLNETDHRIIEPLLLH